MNIETTKERVLEAAKSNRGNVHVCFTLSMPSNNAWNGKWSGANRRYEIVRSYGGKAGHEKAAKILEPRSYRYSFGDGWVACVSVREVTPQAAKTIKRTSDGFCGYDWMITSIVQHGKITTSEDRMTYHRFLDTHTER